MPNTYKFWKNQKGGKWQKNEEGVHGSVGRQGDDDIFQWETANKVSFNIGPYKETIDLDVDSVEIDNDPFTGTKAELQDELIEVFQKPNSGNGQGSGVGTYAEMIANGTPSAMKTYKVANDENKGQTNTIYQVWPDGTRIWMAAVIDN